MGADVENERTTKPDSAASAWTAGLGITLLPETYNQTWIMTVCEGPDTNAEEVGHWYSPAAVANMLSRACQSEREGWRYADELEQERKRLVDRVETLRGALKTASGWILDAYALTSSEAYAQAMKCIEMAGDMEPSNFTKPNVELCGERSESERTES
jgi:hypothetical protein